MKPHRNPFVTLIAKQLKKQESGSEAFLIPRKPHGTEPRMLHMLHMLHMPAGRLWGHALRGDALRWAWIFLFVAVKRFLFG